MATQIVILNSDYIKIDDSFHIDWADKGNAWQDAWCPNTIHAVIWNNLQGQNEIQNKDASTGNMTNNTNLNATSDGVGSTTVANLLSWAETRKSQIQAAETAYSVAKADGSASDGEDWRDYDSNYS